MQEGKKWNRIRCWKEEKETVKEEAGKKKKKEKTVKEAGNKENDSNNRKRNISGRLKFSKESFISITMDLRCLRCKFKRKKKEKKTFTIW